MKVWMPYVLGGSGLDVFTKSLAEGLRRLGHEVVTQPFDLRWQAFPWPLRQVRAPRATDVVLGNTWSGFAFARPGIPLVTVQHLFVLDPAYTPYKTAPQRLFHSTLVRAFERASLRASSIQIAVSAYTAKAQHTGLGGGAPRAILNGIDTSYFTPSRQEAASRGSGTVRLLFVGNPSIRKGADLLPGILSRLGPVYELEYTAGLRGADGLSDVPNARCVGSLDRAGVRAAYRRADLLLFPTRLEGLPLVAMEAMACGLPVIASAASSLSEVVEHDVTGRLCSPDDEEDFARSIRALGEDLPRRREMGNAARLRAERLFNEARMFQEYAEVLEEARQRRDAT